MDLSILPIICRGVAGGIVSIGGLVGLACSLRGSGRGTALAWIWSCLPAAGLAAGSWAWVPAIMLIERIAGLNVFLRGDYFFGILYAGSPILGTIAGLVAAALVTRRTRPRRQAQPVSPPDDWRPPDPGTVERLIGGP